MVFVFLANGFEEIEALATVDMLRRAGIAVKTVGIDITDKEKCVTGSHNISIKTDITENEIDFNELNDENGLNAVILPGGMPGTLNLKNSEIVNRALEYAQKNNILTAAICAAPSVLGEKELLKGKKAVCYPGFEEKLLGAKVLFEPAVNDCENGCTVITARGAGACFNFGYEIIKALKGKETAEKIKESMLCII